MMAGGAGPLPLAERVFVVTGATDGIGKFTAEQLAGTGATVAVHGRNPQKVQAVVQEVCGMHWPPLRRGLKGIPSQRSYGWWAGRGLTHQAIPYSPGIFSI